MRPASRIAGSDAGGALFPGRTGQRDGRKGGRKTVHESSHAASLIAFLPNRLYNNDRKANQNLTRR